MWSAVVGVDRTMVPVAGSTEVIVVEGAIPEPVTAAPVTIDTSPETLTVLDGAAVAVATVTVVESWSVECWPVSLAASWSAMAL